MRYMQKYPELYDALAEIIKQQCSISNPTIVDLGTGPGLLGPAIFKKIPQAKVVGVDPLQHMLVLAQHTNKLFSSFFPLLGKAEHLPLKTQSVDLVISRFSLPYWEHQQECFREIYRVLKPGGSIVFEVLNKDFSSVRLWFVRFHMMLRGASSMVIRYHLDAYKQAHTMDDIKKLLQPASFRNIQILGARKDWKFTVLAQK
ncbi:MAG: class I SAM-dependent methyltransferase [Candidatus Thermoplasmatota archaeon]